MSELLLSGPAQAKSQLLLAHGAGAGMDHPFMTQVAEGLAGHGIAVRRFEFPYMQRRRQSGKRSPPDRMPILEQAFRDQIASARERTQRLFIGGKSMGGRVASRIADSENVDGLICLGYPFHPAGKPDKLRTEHLADLKTTTLIIQGERDALGSSDEVTGYELADSIRLHWLTDGDHSFKPRVRAGATLDDNIESAIKAMVNFMGEH